VNSEFCIVWGASGQCKVINDILRNEGCKLIHIFDNNTSVQSPFPDIPISYGVDGFVKFVNSLSAKGLSPDQVDCITTIGGQHGGSRQELTRYMSQYGFRPRSIVHGTAIISDSAVIGDSCQILSGAIIGALAHIGDFTIINTGACIEHDCTIGDCSHVASMATLSGEVKLGRNVFIGANATLLPRISIGDNSIIGAGAVVTRSFGEGTIALGNPARNVEHTPTP